jgi:hypothetical protein
MNASMRHSRQALNNPFRSLPLCGVERSLCFHGLNLHVGICRERLTQTSFSFRINNLAGQEWPALPAETAW